MRIGIYGGTFSPPHRGHRRAAETAAKQLGLDRLLIVPASIPPHKELPDGDPGEAARLKMTEFAFDDMEKALVSDMEMGRSGPSFTVDTIREITKDSPEAELYLMMGTDMFLYIENWKDFRDILDMASLCVFARGSADTEKIESFAGYLEKSYGARVRIIRNEAYEISSSEIRERLPKRQGMECLDGAVYSYILQNRLYGAKADFDWLRTQAYKMLLPKRIPHVQGCEIMAVELARFWKADENEAREAAILHDITKKDDLSSQLILCDKYGIILDTFEKSEVKLLHSKTGAGIARDRFAVSDGVYSAIFWHTTGKADMSLLEKIIYMADYIEPTRDFDGLRELRRLAFEDIDAAMLLGLQMSIDDMRSRGIEAHSRSREAIEWFLTKKQ